MEDFLNLSRGIYNIFKNNTDANNNKDTFSFELPLRIKKYKLIIDVKFYISVNISTNHRKFNLISKDVLNNTSNLILYSHEGLFENLPKFIKDKDADYENINSLAIFIEYCYKMINKLEFDLKNAIFVEDNVIDYLSMIAFNDENKIYFTEKCEICHKDINTKTICDHNLCYLCILNIDQCPICKQDMKLKFLKRIIDYREYNISYFNYN